MFIKKNKTKFTLNLFKKTYGVGSISLKFFFNYYGINTRLHKLKIKQEFSNKIRILVDELTFRKTLKAKLITQRKFVVEKLKNYISLRYVLRYPIRGQRTHTNGNTRRKLKSKNPFLT
jgi:ribosomal protein S13